MKAIKTKALFAVISLFAFTAIHAQDTTNKPRPDTTKPKPDSTVIIKMNKVNSEHKTMVTSTFLMVNDNKVSAKSEGIDNKEVS